MHKITHVQTRPGSILKVTFSDGVCGELCIAERLFGPMFEPLKDPELFAQAKVDSFGIVCWPNGADLDSDVLYRAISAGTGDSQTDNSWDEFFRQTPVIDDDFMSDRTK